MKIFDPKSILLCCSIIVFLIGCADHRTKTTRFDSSAFKKEKLETKNRKPTPRPLGIQPKSTSNNSCSNYRNYVPDTSHVDHSPIRTIRVNIHVMNAADSSQNFAQNDARKFIGELFDHCNNSLDSNKRMWLTEPRGQILKPLPTRYRYQMWPNQIDAFHFHYDDELYFFVSKGQNQNNYDQKVLKKYNVGGDSIINFYFMPHHPDSQKTKTYTPGQQGIALGNSMKVAGIFENRQQGPHAFNGLVNHEVGHILGLAHAWMPDGCDDTPEHRQNCWTWTPEPPCNADAYNNVMDYNAYQDAWSPCQIGRIQQNLATETHPARRALRPDWCVLDEKQTIVVRDSVDWLGAKDLNGHLRVARGGRLRIACRVSMPPDSKITVEAGGRLILDGATLHQACGQTWRGIEIEQKRGEKGLVETLGAPVFLNLRED